MVYMGSIDTELPAGDKRSVIDITVEYVMGKISRKERKPGTKIPAELKLVEMLRASRNSVWETIKVPIALGLLEIRHVDGTYVVNRFSEKAITPWVYSLLLEDDNFLVLLELRMIIERGISSLTTQKDTEEDMRTIYDVSEHLIVLAQDVQATFSEILDTDIRYWEEIYEASHNRLTVHLNDIIAFASLHSREKSIEEAIVYNDRFRMIDSRRKLTEITAQRRTADLNEVFGYRYKHWGIALQNQR